MKRNIISIFILLTIIFISSIIFHKIFNYKYEKTELISNGYEVTLNNTKLNYYIKEEYEINYFPLLFSESRTIQNTFLYENEQNKLNDITLDTINIRLDIKEFECIYKTNNIRQSCKSNQIEESIPYNKNYVTPKVTTMKVKHKNNTLYNGKFTNDLSKIVTDDGRYHFNIKLRSGKNLVELIFSVIVSGDLL